VTALSLPLYIRIEHVTTGRAWVVTGWQAGAVLLAFTTLVVLLIAVSARLIWEARR
jgi:hypothetical protein